MTAHRRDCDPVTGHACPELPPRVAAQERLRYIEHEPVWADRMREQVQAHAAACGLAPSPPPSEEPE